MSMTTTHKAPRKTCTSHCRTCDRHFHGDTAFDLHRIGGHCIPPEARFNRKGEPLLAVWTQTGICTLQDPSCETLGMIWQGVGGYNRAAAELTPVTSAE